MGVSTPEEAAMREFNIPADTSERVSEASGSDYFPAFDEVVRRVAPDVVVVHTPKAEWDHLFRNERASRALQAIERRSAAAKGRTDNVKAPGEDVYGPAKVRGWDPVLETLTDVPARIRPGDFETLERQILDPDT
jgi:hypothetical protein